MVEDALGKTIRCPECAGKPDPVAADGRTIEALQAEVARLTVELTLCEMFQDHSSVVRGIIAAAGELPILEDGDFKDGFIAAIEEVSARADIHAGDDNHQMHDLACQIIDLIQGNAVIVMAKASEYLDAISRAEAAEAEVARLRAALLDPQGPNLGGKTRETGLMTILTAHYRRDMTGADAADLAARYLDALKGGA